jgi:5-oxoprolinase (ATP-hydrolysing) subunit C
MSDALLLTDGGLFSTVQDFGRFGYQRFGISASGAMDVLAMRLANALVGNQPDTAVIETTLSGPAFVVEAPACRLAFTGIDARITLNGAPVAPYRAFDAAFGDRVAIGPGTNGLRGYLALAGGLALDPVLGSLSTHSRSRIGGFEGRQLAAGDRLLLPGCVPAGPCLELPASERPSADGPIRVLLGPQDDAFTSEGIQTFLSSLYTVSNKTDRMGCQLEGPAITHRAGFNIVSDGIMNGSIQVPGHGRPIVLLADRQTTGGYPKIATVIEADLRKLAQARPGSTLAFTALSAEAAEEAAATDRRRLSALIEKIRPVASEASLLTAERLLCLNLVSGVHYAESD